MHPNTDTAPQAGEVAVRIAEGLGLEPQALNEMDFTDVSVSEAVLEVLRQLARSLTGKDPQATALPRLNAFWVERSHELVLAATLRKELGVLVVPSSQWSVSVSKCH